jgi:hypothetical protein
MRVSKGSFRRKNPVGLIPHWCKGCIGGGCNLLLPRRDRFGDLVWKTPRVASVLSIFKHPAYAGAFTYGRTRTIRREASPARPSINHLPMEEWRVCIPDVYPPYIS